VRDRRSDLTPYAGDKLGSALQGKKSSDKLTMAETKTTKGKTKKRTRKERRFVGEQTYASKLTTSVGMLGALGLGAGVYAQWVSDNPGKSAPYLLVAGALLLGGSLYYGDAGTLPVRVGDAGIAIERGKELERVAWCDLERVYVKDGKLRLDAKGGVTFEIVIDAHPKGVARILAEGTRRVPAAMDVKRSAVSGVPEPRDDDGEVLVVESIQVAGRECAASGKTIAFERDARLCPQCCQVYLKDVVPKKCLTCEAELGDRAVRA
jgi:hypothetical protein